MKKSKIEWTDYTINPIKGKCKNKCSYCYAKKMYDRFKWNPEVRLKLSEMDKIRKIKKPSKIFVCSMHELFGEWIPSEWTKSILDKIKEYPQHTFLILTKCIERAYLWSLPDNVWLGVSIDTIVGSDLMYLRSAYAVKRFISFEPLLAEIDTDLKEIDWVIIGAQTQPTKLPKKEWVQKIIDEAKRHKIPVFLKDNLKWPEVRREFPA